LLRSTSTIMGKRKADNLSVEDIVTQQRKRLKCAVYEATLSEFAWQLEEISKVAKDLSGRFVETHPRQTNTTENEMTDVFLAAEALSLDCARIVAAVNKVTMTRSRRTSWMGVVRGFIMQPMC